MNTNLQTLISLQQTSEATSAMQFLGSSVTVSGQTAALAANAPATWSLNSPSPATANITITNSTGQTVYTGSMSLNAGTQTYTWNGQGYNGVTYPAGQYTLSISATGANGQPVTVSTQVQGTVSGINLSQNPPQLTVGTARVTRSARSNRSTAIVPARSAASTPASAILTAVSAVSASSCRDDCLIAGTGWRRHAADCRRWRRLAAAPHLGPGIVPIARAA